MRLPEDALQNGYGQRRPVLFGDVYGLRHGPRFASSSEVIVTEKDVPAFQQGMTLIKISDALTDGSPGCRQGHRGP